MLGLGVIEKGGMKLNKFHIGYSCAGPVSHSYTGPRGDIRVAGIEVDLAHTTRCKQRNFRTESMNLTCVPIQDIGPVTDVSIPSATFYIGLCYKVNSKEVFINPDILTGFDTLNQNDFYFAACEILGIKV